jgi:hypothetical protein
MSAENTRWLRLGVENRAYPKGGNSESAEGRRPRPGVMALPLGMRVRAKEGAPFETPFSFAITRLPRIKTYSLLR